jgi:hypothetical protein
MLLGALVCVAGVFFGCGGNTFDVIVAQSPEVPENEAPTITLFEPDDNLAISQGDSFVARWTDRDADDNAMISLELVQTDGSLIVVLASDIPENDNLAPDSFVVETSDVPLGEFFLRATISDGVNTPAMSFASDLAGNRVRTTITQQGLGQSNRAPRVFVAEPDVNLGVAQNDALRISIQPNPGPPPVQGVDPGPPGHYDQDGNSVNVVILLDLDQNPSNDDFTNEDDPGIIILDQRFIPAGSFEQIPFDLVVDVQEIPVRRNGQPYFIRATASDGLSVVHAYATGTLHVLEFVEGSASTVRLVDLAQVGRTLAGATWLGFSPLANLGTKMTTAKDIDNDGTQDAVVVAQFGNPRQVGNIGEAYLIFGTAGRRFGGSININSVASDDPDLTFGRVRGNVFNPQVDNVLSGAVDIGLGDDRRIGFAPLTEPYTMGIHDVVAIDNLGGNGGQADQCELPELLFGLPHTEYTGSTRDDDLGDDPDEGTCIFCYPDNFPNNYCTDGDPDPSLGDLPYGFENRGAAEDRSGTVALFYGENAISAVDDTTDTCNTLEARNTDVFSLSTCGDQYAGARFNVAIYDNFGATLGGGGEGQEFRIDPLNAHDGWSVGVLSDIDLNGREEIIISAPRNEIESQEIRAEFGENHPHLQSRMTDANVIVWLGQNFAALTTSHDGGDVVELPFATIRVPQLPSCSPNNPRPRFLESEYDVAAAGVAHPNPANNVTVEPGWFAVRGEKPTDKVGFARGAGDFNQDGPADLLVGAPFADPRLDLDGNGVPDDPEVLKEHFDLESFDQFDAGTAYVIYLRLPFGNIDLVDANNTDDIPPTAGGLLTRPPMLRIFGESPMDHLGQRQEPARDVDGDRIDDVLIASQDFNGQGLVDSGAVAVIYGGQRVTGDRRFVEIGTPRLRGTIFYGTNPGDLAGADISAGGDFNGDGLGDFMISAPGEDRFVLGEDKARTGVVYLIFGGRHLADQVFTLGQVGTSALPGIVFVGPYQKNTPDAVELDQPVFVRSRDCAPYDDNGDLVDSECLCNPELEELCPVGAAPDGRCCALLQDEDGTVGFRRVGDGQPGRVGFIGDINADGFDDVMIGNPTADFFDPRVAVESRRRDSGEVYLIYGNNFRANTIIPAPPPDF